MACQVFVSGSEYAHARGHSTLHAHAAHTHGMHARWHSTLHAHGTHTLNGSLNTSPLSFAINLRLTPQQVPVATREIHCGTKEMDLGSSDWVSQIVEIDVASRQHDADTAHPLHALEPLR
eukprot:138417-Rhodomonas_salina.3